MCWSRTVTPRNEGTQKQCTQMVHIISLVLQKASCDVSLEFFLVYVLLSQHKQTIKLRQGLLPPHTSILFIQSLCCLLLISPRAHVLSSLAFSSLHFSLGCSLFTDSQPLNQPHLHLIYIGQPAAPEASPQLYIINAN